MVVAERRGWAFLIDEVLWVFKKVSPTYLQSSGGHTIRSLLSIHMRLTKLVFSESIPGFPPCSRSLQLQILRCDSATPRQ